MILRRKVGIVILVAITFILNSVAETTHTHKTELRDVNSEEKKVNILRYKLRTEM